MEKRRLCVLSFDAFVYDDLEYAKTLPNFAKMLTGARVSKVRSVYPSLTYPCHVTMMTGAYPQTHGVPNNELPQPGREDADWYWTADCVKAETILDAAHKAGYSTAAINWPVTAGSKSIDHILGEMWNGGNFEDYLELIAAHGADKGMIELAKANRNLLDGHNPPDHPYFDEYAFGVTVDVIKKYAPDVVFSHICHLDSARHQYGVFGEHICRALDRLDLGLGKIFAAYEELGLFENTDFVITSDHGQMNFMRWSALNTILAEKGWLTAKGKEITAYRAFVKSAGLSAQVFVEQGESEKFRSELYDELCAMRDTGLYGFDEILTRAEVKERYKLDGGFDFVLEGDGATAFLDGVHESAAGAVDPRGCRYFDATHGHMPDKGPTPTFLCMGPHFVPGAIVDTGSLADEAPTYAALLGVSLSDAEGTAVSAILK